MIQLMLMFPYTTHAALGIAGSQEASRSLCRLAHATYLLGLGIVLLYARYLKLYMFHYLK